MKNGDMPAMPLPQSEYSENYTHGKWDGLTKREYFAAMAMQGLLTCAMDTGASISEFAEDSVVAADALLAELEKDQ